jgi:polar amino acid transport system substrate-binding protein
MMFPFSFQPASSEIRSALAPLGFLRAGINLSNTLLVSARTSEGEPDGVSPDMARAVGAALDVPVRLIPYQTPGEVADAIVCSGRKQLHLRQPMQRSRRASVFVQSLA